MSVLEEFVWREIYRPKTVADCILPPRLKTLFQSIVDQGKIPDMLFWGTPGTGKTTVAKAMCEQLGLTYYAPNGAGAERGIDTVRTEITPFASTMAFNGKRKVIIVDEADGLTADAQDALKKLIEEFSKNCSFIFIANNPSKIIEPLHSRCMGVEFRILPEEQQAMMLEMFKRCREILAKESKTYDVGALGLIVKKFFPDNRRIINEIQKQTINDSLRDDIIKSLLDPENFGALYAGLKGKNLKTVREWVVAYVDMSNIDTFITHLYQNIKIYMKPETIPAAVVTFAKYQDMATRVANQEINIMACLIEIMNDCEFI
jgi:DNA polymerase III gamma/tau subunit